MLLRLFAQILPNMPSWTRLSLCLAHLHAILEVRWEPTMTRFTLEIETDGSNDILNLNVALKPHLRELRGRGIAPYVHRRQHRRTDHHGI